MPQHDSIDKIVTSYFSAVTRETFNYKGKTYEPKALHVSPLLFRGFTCPANCGGCCHSTFSLDYLPSEKRPDHSSIKPRHVMFNGKSISIWSDVQEDNTETHCRNLLASGRCAIHGVHPFSCDFELIRFFHSEGKSRLSQQLYGRGWNMMRVDGKRGALCEMLPPTAETRAEVVRKLRRLLEWTNHFKLFSTCVGGLLHYAKNSDGVAPGYIEADRQNCSYQPQGFFSE